MSYRIEIPEDMLNVLILVGNCKEYHIDQFTSIFNANKYLNETEQEYVQRSERITKAKRNITNIQENRMNNVQLLLEISKSTWDNNDYTHEKLYKSELIPDRFINEPDKIMEYLDNYETQLIQYGWVETSRGGYFARLSTDDGSVDKRHIWLDSDVCQYEISKRRHFAGPVLDDWRERAINRDNEYRKDTSIYEKNIDQETMPVISGPMRRTDQGSLYAFPIQLLVATKTNPPLAPRGVINTFPPNS